VSVFSFRLDRKLISRVAVVATALFATGVCAASASSATPAAGVDTSRPSISQLGFDPGYANVTQLQTLESWLGRDSSYLVQFAASSDVLTFESSVWGQVTAAGGFQSMSEAARTTFVESIPLTIGLGQDATTDERAAALSATLAGTYDSAYQLVAQYLEQAGFANVIVRLGWEYDGDWMPWSANGNEALWADAYRHVADVFRSVIPTVAFDWSGDPTLFQGEVSAYPGDDYVDIVGLDLYDKDLHVDWDPSTQSWADPAAAFSEFLPSLTDQRDFAIAHGKQVSYPEWALSSGGTESPTSAGNDDPAFVQGLYDWMNALPSTGPGSLAYHAYFNEDTSNDGDHALAHFPNAQERFRSLFGTPPPATAQPLPIRRAAIRAGYSMLGADGTVYAFGAARNAGNAPGPGVAIATRSDGMGYWIVDTAGNVSHFGTAAGHGGRPPLRADEWVSAISSTPSGNGYWLFTIRGRVFAYGDAILLGDLGAAELNGPVIGSVATPSGRGYYMVASDGGVFGFGDARFRGSMGAMHLNRPIVGLSPTPNGRGYWLVASDGGVFAFDAPFRGSMGGTHLARAVNGLVAYGNGYLMVASDGGVFDFSDKAFVGSFGSSPPRVPIIGIAAVVK
jgi:hypothetical protein